MAEAPNPYRRPEGSATTREDVPRPIGWAVRLVWSLVFTAGVIFIAVQAARRPPPPAAAPSFVRGEQPGSVLLWDPRGGDPVVVAADLELVIGRLREIPDERLFVGLFTATGQLRERIGPLGAPGSDSAVRFAVHDGVIVVSEPGQLRMHDVRQARPPRTLEVVGAARRLCSAAASPGAAPQLYVVGDGDAQILDPQAGTLQAAPLPVECLTPPTPARPDVPGLSTLRAHSDGERTIAIGLDEATGRSLIAAAITSETGEWQTPLAADPSVAWDPTQAREVLAGGRLIATYDGPDAPRRLTVLDARTGVRLWDQALRTVVGADPFGGLVASARHVYVVRATSVEVYDAATGALVSTLGSDSYGR